MTGVQTCALPISYGCSVKSKHANKLKHQTQALMGATRLEGHFSAVSSRVIGKKLHLLLSIVCIFPFNYPDARRDAPISACVFFQRVSSNLIVLLLKFKSLHSVWPEPFRVGASDFFISKK